MDSTGIPLAAWHRRAVTVCTPLSRSLKPQSAVMMGVSVSVVRSPTPVSRIDSRRRDDVAGWPCLQEGLYCHGCGYLLVGTEEVS